MVLYNFDEHFKTIDYEDKVLMFEKINNYILESLNFEYNFIYSPGMTYNSLKSYFLFKEFFYFKIKKYFKKSFFENSKLINIEHLLIKAKEEYKTSVEFDFKLFLNFLENVIEYFLFKDFLLKNEKQRLVKIDKLKYVNVLLSFKYNINIISSNVTEKLKRVARNLDVNIFSGKDKMCLDGENIKYENNFELTSIGNKGLRRIIDLREFYKYDDFYLLPSYVKEFINFDYSQCYVILPFFYNSTSKLFNSNYNGSFKVIIEYEYLFDELLKELVKNSGNSNLTIVISNLSEYADYNAALYYFKSYKKYRDDKYKVGVLVDDIEDYQLFIKPKNIYVDQMLYSLDNIIRNNFYSETTEYEKFSKEMIAALRDNRIDYNNKKVKPIMIVTDEMTEYNIEKLINMGYKRFGLSHKNTQKYNKVTNIVSERRKKQPILIKGLQKTN